MTTLQDSDAGVALTPAPVSDPTNRRKRHRLSSRVRPSWLLKYRLPKKARPATPLSNMVTWALLALSGIAIWIVSYALVVSSLQHAHDQAKLYSQFREQLALETAPIGNPCNADSGTTCGPIAAGKPVALMNFPAAGLRNEVVVEGTSAGDLVNGPGHLRNSPLPGQAGVSVIFGRAKLFGGPFHAIAFVHPGDLITVTTGEGTAKYVVTLVRHAGDRFPELASGAGRLTLVTAEGGGWRSGWAPSKTVFVDATLQGSPFTDPGFRPTSVPKAENPMQPDSGSLYVLVLWLPLLVLAALLGVWAHQNWGRWQTWLVGVPIVLGGLWGVSQTAILLLPNLM